MSKEQLKEACGEYGLRTNLSKSAMITKLSEIMRTHPGSMLAGGAAAAGEAAASGRGRGVDTIGQGTMLQAASVRPARPPVGARGGDTSRVSRVANEGSLRGQSAGGGGANQEVNDHPWGANEQRIERELVDWIKGDRALFERLLLFETVNIHSFHSKVGS